MDSSSIIRKTASDLRLVPKLTDYKAERQCFSWEAVVRELALQSGGGLNIAWQTVNRRAAGRLRGRPNRVVTYDEIAGLAGRFCNLLRSLGVVKSERMPSLRHVLLVAVDDVVAYLAAELG